MKNIPAQIIGRFLERTPQSQALTERARRVMPGGDTRAGVYYAPDPAYRVAGAGSQIVDADGNHYVDFLNNYTSLVHGHGPLNAASGFADQADVVINARIAAFQGVVERCPGWQISSIGAYFAYVSHPFAGVPAERVAEALAVGRGVLGLPGSHFGLGQEGHLRFAFANADEAAIATLPARLADLRP